MAGLGGCNCNHCNLGTKIPWNQIVIWSWMGNRQCHRLSICNHLSPNTRRLLFSSWFLKANCKYSWFDVYLFISNLVGDSTFVLVPPAVSWTTISTKLLHTSCNTGRKVCNPIVLGQWLVVVPLSWSRISDLSPHHFQKLIAIVSLLSWWLYFNPFSIYIIACTWNLNCYTLSWFPIYLCTLS